MKNKIILVDDNVEIREMLIKILKNDFECVPFENSSEGNTYLENNSVQIDLIILELEEMVKTNFKILKSIQGHYLYGKVPILVLLSVDQMKHIDHIFDLGVDDVLIKPFSVELAQKRIHNMLDIGKNRSVHNVMEDLIQSEINQNIDILGICTCPQCRKDLLTLTLNNVKPKYVSTEKGEAIIKAGRLASMDDRLSLLAEITRYAQLVGANPHHD